MLRLIKAIFLVISVSGCSFKFELTSQRTALENQILGTYKELDEDLILVSSSSATNNPAGGAANKHATGKHSYQKAQLNREFNKMDIADLKDEQILGETWDGRLVLLPKGTGLVDDANPAQLKLAEIVTFEENRDRQMLWEQAAAESDNLVETDAREVIEAFVGKIWAEAKPGHWLQESGQTWMQKGSSTK